MTMEQFSMQILQNDVEHLEKNMKTFSQQLRILQDFIKIQFGPEFQDFYAKQISLITQQPFVPIVSLPLPTPTAAASAACPNSSSRTVRSNKRNAMSRIDLSDIQNESSNVVAGEGGTKSKSARNEKIDKPPTIYITGTGETEPEEKTKQQTAIKPECYETVYSESDEENDQNGEFEDYFEIGDDVLGLQDSSNEATSIQDDPEYEPGSSKKKRLVKSTSPAKSKKSELLEKFIVKPTNNRNTTVQCKACKVFVSNRPYRLKAHLQDNCFANKNRTRELRKTQSPANKSSIRQYFETCIVNNMVKSKCLKCGDLVSNKAWRMTKHYEQCEQVGLNNDDSENDIKMDETRNSDDGSENSKPAS